MGLGGRLPRSIGQLGVNLKNLLLQENQIFGSIPENFSNLSRLLVLNLTSNLLNGTISPEIRKLSNLQQLFLSHNHFNRTIPPALGEFPHLGLLDLSHNKFSGGIPDSLANLVRINYLFLNNNLLSGTIPSSLGRCTELHKLDFSYNRLTGSIPPELLGMSEIRIFINLSHNQLEGPLPIELSKLENVQEMDLSSNRLTGSIFPQISSCIALRLINFSNNFLQGHIPASLGDMKNLQSLDVSSNQLSGVIPATLNKIDTLKLLNLSFNNLEGVIPSGGIFNLASNLSFLGNPYLCGTVASKSICSQRRQWFQSRMFLIIFIVVTCTSAFLSTIFCVIGYRRIRVTTSSSEETEMIRKTKTPELMHNFPRITYKELSDATTGFDDQKLVGSGSYGRVYKGVLPDGTAIAVKALVLPYMANGSLDSRLYSHSALVSDFGISRLVMSAGGGNAGVIDNMGNSTANLLCGSIGYIAPEYGFGSNTSTKGDVYSFGILVLEMITRKRPTDDMFVGGLSLQIWVKSHYHGRVERVIDPSLGEASRDQSPEVKRMWETAIAELVELGILCTQESPSTRPTMLDAADDLDRLKRYLTGDTTATFASSLGISSSTIGDD
ncbi:Leucine-rich receptor-like protein kinase family protein [Quillaja saponaria]|uniref:Leucine-rich receptor-like protein kinase family protein n=1 Tax=Quillaja saponaria TaxID=32244 RepID=A0AAD7PDU8_QUISA|nr:Leucine-rich receptor-like protein kinase family protein [Quillaja saponaria]